MTNSYLEQYDLQINKNDLTGQWSLQVVIIEKIHLNNGLKTSANSKQIETPRHNKIILKRYYGDDVHSTYLSRHNEDINLCFKLLVNFQIIYIPIR